VFGRKRESHYFSLLMICSILAVYAGFWYHGVCFGARYYYSLIP